MRLTAGDKIVYPFQGPCLIGSIVEKVIDDRPLMFYQLVVLSEGGDLFVPIDKVKTVGIRLLLEESEIPKLLDRLKEPAKAVDGWKQRNLENLRLFASGSAFDLAEIVETLTELSETKALSFGESSKLKKAKRLLICEISEVTGETKEDVEQQVDNALKARKEAACNLSEAYKSSTSRSGSMREVVGDRK